MTVRVSFIVQQRFQDFRRQAVRLRVTADLVHDFLQRARRAGRQFAQAEAEEQFQFPSVLRGGGGEGAGGVGINFERDGCGCHDLINLPQWDGFSFPFLFFYGPLLRPTPTKLSLLLSDKGRISNFVQSG